MANEYEIKDVGYVGSLWQGTYNSPVLVGSTFEVINVPNTINNGGYKKSICFASKVGINTDKLTKQTPEDGVYYKIGNLPESEVQNLLTSAKLDPEYSRKQKVLFRFSPRYGESPESSRIPLQDNWSFDISNPDEPTYIYGNPDSITWVSYIFLVNDDEVNPIKEYFLGINQVETIFEPDIVANPSKAVSAQPEVSTVMPPPPNGFSNVNTFTPPPYDPELYATEMASIEFQNVREFYEVSSLDEANRRLKEVEMEMRAMYEAYSNRDTQLPFSDMTIISIRVKLLILVREYLLEQIGLITQAGNPIQNPDRYTVTTTGDIEVVEPEVLTFPQSIEKESDGIVDEFDEFIDEIIEDLTLDDNDVYAFKRISRITDYSTPVVRNKTHGMFSCNGERLGAYYTQSLSAKNSKYYTSVLSSPNNGGDYHQFDITYAHISGSGSSYTENSVDLLPAKVMYRKYLLECFGTTDGKFPFKNGKHGDYFYAIQLDRDLYRDGIDLGNFELIVAPISSSVNQLTNTGSGYYFDYSSSVLYSLIDNSLDSKQGVVDRENTSDFYYLVSGSIRDGIYDEPTQDAWGVVFPKMGLIILDGVVLDQSCSFNTVTASIDGDNSRKLFISISGSATKTYGRQDTGSFFARSIEKTLTETYFCRVDTEEFNYSSNYTYVSGSDGFFKYSYFEKDPTSYITTIGLYNNDKELIAVGKLPKPIKKDDGKTYTFQVRVRLN